MPATKTNNRPEELTERLSSAASGGGGGDGGLLKVLREVKNQIIGNRTKKLWYLKLGAVPTIVSILSSAADSDSALIVQAAAALGSFACGVDAGARAVLDGGAVPILVRLLSNRDEKVVDACARSLRMVFQSNLAPKYDILEEKNMHFFLSLLNSENDNVTELAASIITHSCETTAEQKALCDNGVLQRLIALLEGSTNQRDAGLDSLAAIMKSNSDVVSKLVTFNNGRALNSIIELVKDRCPRTRLLACICLIIIGNACADHLKEFDINTELILVLVELFEEPGRAGDDAPYALANLIAGKEDLHKQAFSVNAVEKLCNFLHKNAIEAKRLQGILLALAELCSKLEICRTKSLSLKGTYGETVLRRQDRKIDLPMSVLDIVIGALKHDCTEVRIAACTCLRSISRSLKSLSAGHLLNEAAATSLIQLLHNQSTEVQVAALGAVCNVVVDFAARKSVFLRHGGAKELVQLSRSMDSKLRLNAVRALRNLLFLADKIVKENILQELTISTLASLVCDAEASIQEQAMALIRNLIDGSVDCIDHIFAEDDLIITAVARQLWGATVPVCIQGMYVLSNVAAGNDFHKDAVMHHILLPHDTGSDSSILLRFLQNNDGRLRTAAIWCVINLTYPGNCTASERVTRLRTSGVVSQIKSMVNDPCLDVKHRVRTALEQCTVGGINSA
ncbi:hypothetical protein QJS10_CPA06g01807 [Acorus calamus]|uniref:Armadillo repeat-containing protein 8 n=1 Tax=Acorus calamus TaxID=4465 RepID=A0AAV9EIS5_ACOCL|nr:hypothetical protein QJS10_CPA06g01807 [Acorus calamus]